MTDPSLSIDASAASPALAWYIYFFWGFLGGLMLDCMEFVRVIRASPSGRPPKRMYTWWAIGMIPVRAGLGGGLSVAFGLSGQAPTPLAAAVIGIAAPTILEKLAQTVDPARVVQ